MKINLFILSMVWVLSGVFVYSCIVIDGHSFRIETVNDSGTITSEEREVPAFNQLILKGAGKVILTRG